MGLFNRIFGGQSRELGLLVEAIERLQIGIVILLCLEYNKHNPRIKSGEELVLSSCVLSYATLMQPDREEVRQYFARYGSFVRSESLKLHTHPQLAEALSCLYAALTLFLVKKTGNPFAARDLATRASELSLYIPNTFDLCGTGSSTESIAAISRYAGKLKQELKSP